MTSLMDQLVHTEELPVLPTEWAEQLALSDGRWGRHVGADTTVSERVPRTKVSVLWWWLGAAALVGSVIGVALPQPGGQPGGPDVSVVPTTAPPVPTARPHASRPARVERIATEPTSANGAQDRASRETVTGPARTRQTHSPAPPTSTKATVTASTPPASSSVPPSTQPVTFPTSTPTPSNPDGA